MEDTKIITKPEPPAALPISQHKHENINTFGIIPLPTEESSKKLDDKCQYKHITDQIIKNSNEAIVILDQNRKIKMWNSGARKIFGYRESEILNKLIEILIPKEEREKNKDLIKAVEENKYIRNVEVSRMRKNKTLVDVTVSITKVMDKKGEFIGYLVIYNDISQQKHSDRELQKRFESIQDAYKELGLQKRQADYIYDIAESATSAHSNIEELNKLIVSAACMLTKCEGVTLRKYTKENNSLVLTATIGVNKKWQDKSRIPLKGNLAEEAFKNKRPMIINDVETNKKYTGKNLIAMHGFKTLILIPLIMENELIGTLSLYTSDPSKFRLIETDFLDRFGKQCAMATYSKSQS